LETASGERPGALYVLALTAVLRIGELLALSPPYMQEQTTDAMETATS